MDERAPDQNVHALVVRHVAATRFPFPGQRDWPADFVTITNESGAVRGIPFDTGVEYPDIVVVDGNDAVREIGEVETDLGAELVPKWARFSAASDDATATGVRHFFVYVPRGKEAVARRLLEENEISYAGLRTYAETDGGIAIVPVATPGDPADHR